MSAHASTLRVGLRDVVRTARLPKIAPVPLLAWSGYALRHGRDVLPLAWVTLAVVAVTLLVTRLNVLTDESLDLASRPELARGLRRSARFVVGASVVEVALLCVALLAVDGDARLALVALLAFGVLYSFNFLSPHPVRSRWKAHWLGHAAAFVGSYAALWAAGAGAAGHGGGALVLLVALATGVVDYAVYVGECAIDHDEEASAGLRTAAALLGPRTSSVLALVLFGAGACLHASWITTALAAAFVPPLALRGTFLVALAAAELGGHRDRAHALRSRAADAVFLATRLWTFFALALA